MTLQLDGVCCSIGAKALLTDLTVTLHAGTLYGIVGPNGAGKSSLLKAITALIPLTSGKIKWQGSSLTALPARSRSRVVSYVAQHNATHFDFSVYELVAMGRYPHHRSYHSGDVAAAIDEALASVELLEVKNRPVSSLSGGERQRAHLARAFVGKNPLLLLDEPFASLDLRYQLLLWRQLDSLAASGTLVVVVSHDLMAAASRCHQLLVMDGGCCIAAGTPFTTMTPELTASVFHVAMADSASAPSYQLLY